MTLKTTAKEREEIEKLLRKYYDNMKTNILKSQEKIIDELDFMHMKHQAEMQRFANEIMDYKLRSEK